jgi:hypothetical protein
LGFTTAARVIAVVVTAVHLAVTLNLSTIKFPIKSMSLAFSFLFSKRLTRNLPNLIDREEIVVQNKVNNRLQTIVLENKGLFKFQIFITFSNTAFSFVFDKFYLIMD